MEPAAPTEHHETVAVAPHSSAAQPVNLTDRIPWQWYLVTAGLPLLGPVIGFVAGIVFMARSKIGPALALWATSFLAAAVWSAIGWGIALTWAVDETATRVRVPVLTTSRPAAPRERASEPEAPSPSPSPGDEPRPPGEAASTPKADGARKSCGNLTVTVDAITCAFAQNVFYEYWTATDAKGGFVDSLSAYSPALGRRLELSCLTTGLVSCVTNAGGEVRIPLDALDAYTQADADAYAASTP